jgi:hypothetical protein
MFRKLGVALLLTMCLIGFSMSSVSAGNIHFYQHASKGGCYSHGAMINGHTTKLSSGENWYLNSNKYKNTDLELGGYAWFPTGALGIPKDYYNSVTLYNYDGSDVKVDLQPHNSFIDLYIAVTVTYHGITKTNEDFDVAPYTIINAKVGDRIRLQAFDKSTFEEYGSNFEEVAEAFRYCHANSNLLYYDIDNIEMPWIAVYYIVKEAGHIEFDLNGNHYIFNIEK